MSDAVLKYGEPENYVNRELSWLEFNYRILGEARDKTTPLFERLKFLSITASNLDEFFMVRVASLKDMVHANYTKRDIAGMTAQEQLDAIDGKTHELVENQYRTYNRMLLPLLKQHGLRVVTEHEKLTKEEAVYVDRYFEESVYPVLTPMAVDSSRPFPLIHNKSLNIAALVRKKKGDGELEFATKIKVTHMNNLLPFCLFAGFLFTMQAYTKRNSPAGMSANGRFLTAKKRRAPKRLPAASRMEVISF